MNQGLLLGLILILKEVLFIVFDLYFQTWAGWVSLAITVLVLYWSIRRFREEENSGYLQYWQGVKTGLFTMGFASLLVGFFLYLYYQFIDFESFGLFKQNLEDQLLNQGYPDEQVEAMASMNPAFKSPSMFAIMTVLGNLIMGFIISLIISIFLKKIQDPFSNAMEEIEKPS